MEEKYKIQIRQQFLDCVINTLSRLEKADTYRPFHSALLSETAIKWSRFERSFSTSFGQKVIESVSEIVVKANGAIDARKQKKTTFQLDKIYVDEIDNHISLLRAAGHPERDFNTVFNQIISKEPIGQLMDIRVISDLWWIDCHNKHNYVSIKTVKPNIDQTAEAKKDLLKLKCYKPDCNVYYGLYYNPYGEERIMYNHAQPQSIFDFKLDSVILIGKEYWDKLGGDGCYEEILAIAEEVGCETKNLIESSDY